MSDDRGRKRNTPTGIGPAKPRSGHAAPRGAGLSGNLPDGSRYDANEQQPPRPRLGEDDAHPVRRGDTRHHAYEPIQGGGWDAASTPPRNVIEPPRRNPPASPPPPRGTSYRAPADAFAKTRPADAPREFSERPAASRSDGRDVQRGGAGPSPRPGEPKNSLRLKLEADPYDAPERVRVPKRRAPLMIGFVIVAGTLGGGALLWIDAHGGVDNFVQALARVASGEPASPPAQQAAPPTAAATPTAPAASAPPAQAAQAPAAQPSAAAPQAVAPTAPAEGVKPTATAEPQIATGEVEEPAAAQVAPAPPAAAKEPAAAAPKAAPPKAPAPAKAVPKPPRERPVARTPVRREPVIKIEQLGDGNATDRVLGAAPPDPGGGETLPPPDPPAPE